ncbi:MAG: Cof-type HAD-IIB family hydrolase [Bacillota bacterium]|nr:Cof-type HAD-IIB family hydrolase [Bacillota bacterium]
MNSIIFIDLDGTLLDSHKRISIENKNEIRRAQANGSKIIICTGKVFKAAKRFAQEVGISGPLISCNGAEIRDIKNDELLYSDFLSKKDSNKIVDICRQSDIYFHAYINHDMFTEKVSCPTPLYWKENVEVEKQYRIRISIVPDFKDVIGVSPHNISKFLIVSHDSDQLLKVRKLIEKIETVNVMCSGLDNLEVVNKSVNKGAALKFISMNEKFKSYRTIAIGDSENDLSMLKSAEYRIAMGNAEKSLKNIAHFVSTTNDESGVAKAIEQILKL